MNVLGRVIVNLVIIDTETGGVKAGKHALLSIGAIRVDHKMNVSAEFEVFIKPHVGLEIEQQALDKNKLDVQYLKDTGVDEKEALTQLFKFIQPHGNGKTFPPMVGWNLDFDLDFLKAAHERHAIPWFYNYKRTDIADVWYASNFFQKGELNPGNIDQCALQLLGRKIEHGALSDVIAVKDIIKTLFEIP